MPRLSKARSVSRAVTRSAVSAQPTSPQAEAAQGLVELVEIEPGRVVEQHPPGCLQPTNRTIGPNDAGPDDEYALLAAQDLERAGIDAEIVDIRSTSPMDDETILASVRKTNRVLVVYEDHEFVGFGAEIAAQIADRAFEHLDAPIRRVAGGGAYITPETAERLVLDSSAGSEGPPHSRLSDREFEVFRMIVAGRSVTDIANELKLSVKTISTHKARILEKMELGSQAELVRYAVEHGLVDERGAG